MRAKQIILHAMAVTLLSALCMAQGAGQPGMGQPGMGQPGMGQPGMGQPGMGQPGTNPNNMPPGMSNDSQSMKSPDHEFMMKAAQGGMAEVQLGNLAKQNGGSDAVKQFGERMVTDHSQANDQLRQIALQQGITLPTSVGSKDKRLTKTLQSKQGADFDQAYIRDMVKDHEADVKEFRKEAENGKDPEVKAWAQKTLPTLEQHLEMAKQVAGEVGAGKNAGAMSSKQ